MPALDERVLRVKGLREMQRAFAEYDKDLSRELNQRLKAIAQPVSASAESLARSQIRNIGERWPQMRVGVTRTTVYVAPKERNRRKSKRRPNLAGLLMDRAMSPALDRHGPRILHEVEDLLNELGRDWAR